MPGGGERTGGAGGWVNGLGNGGGGYLSCGDESVVEMLEAGLSRLEGG